MHKEATAEKQNKQKARWETKIYSVLIVSADGALTVIDNKLTKKEAQEAALKYPDSKVVKFAAYR